MREVVDELRQNPPAANRQNEQWRSVNEDTSMPLLQSKLLDADQIPFDDIERWTLIKERAGLDDWRGRFWLPDGDRVDTTRKFCLIRDDGSVGEMIMEEFAASDYADCGRKGVPPAFRMSSPWQSLAGSVRECNILL
jgi:hypothetical protein